LLVTGFVFNRIALRINNAYTDVPVIDRLIILVEGDRSFDRQIVCTINRVPVAGQLRHIHGLADLAVQLSAVGEGDHAVDGVPGAPGDFHDTVFDTLVLAVHQSPTAVRLGQVAQGCAVGDIHGLTVHIDGDLVVVGILVKHIAIGVGEAA